VAQVPTSKLISVRREGANALRFFAISTLVIATLAGGLLFLDMASAAAAGSVPADGGGPSVTVTVPPGGSASTTQSVGLTILPAGTPAGTNPSGAVQGNTNTETQTAPKMTALPHTGVSGTGITAIIAIACLQLGLIAFIRASRAAPRRTSLANG
jgi:hypothetical protein